MKTVYLIRHAKSDWNNPELTDYERPLNKRGLTDLPIMAEKLLGLNFNPQLIVSSPAQRAMNTAELISKEKSILFDSSIYEASLEDLIHLINLLPEKHNEIAIVGHNPSMTYLSNYLTGNTISNMPTCSVIKIEMEIDDWNQIVEGIGTQIYFIFPKMYS
jgi:phosphohistidine phosphatase